MRQYVWLYVGRNEVGYIAVTQRKMLLDPAILRLADQLYQQKADSIDTDDPVHVVFTCFETATRRAWQRAAGGTKSIWLPGQIDWAYLP